MKFVYLSLLAAVVLSSCTYNKKEVVAGSSCDTTNLTYSKILPIIQSNCYECHSNANAGRLGGSNSLEGYDKLFAFVDTTSGSDGGLLLSDISQIAGTGSNPMPKGKAKLDSCSIKQVRVWIQSGAPK